MKQIWAKATFYKKKVCNILSELLYWEFEEENVSTDSALCKVAWFLLIMVVKVKKQATFHETDTDVHNIIDLPHSINM